MQRINFTKMVASGNDFVVIGLSGYRVIGLKRLAQRFCDRKYGAGADGLLVLEKSKIADVKMRIFNADGSEAQMCGNGARCVALWLKRKVKSQKLKVKIETKAGIIETEANRNFVKIKLTEPKNIKLNMPVKLENRTLHVNFINTGVPHAVIFVEGVHKIDVRNIGRQIRYHKKFKPAGTNVDFVELLNNDSIGVRTYERGVEDETLACGTGAVASAIIFTGKLANRQLGQHKINVHTKGGEKLKVYFNNEGKEIKNVWLEGGAKIVYSGVYDV